MGLRVVSIPLTAFTSPYTYAKIFIYVSFLMDTYIIILLCLSVLEWIGEGMVSSVPDGYDVGD